MLDEEIVLFQNFSIDPGFVLEVQLRSVKVLIGDIISHYLESDIESHPQNEYKLCTTRQVSEAFYQDCTMICIYFTHIV